MKTTLALGVLFVFALVGGYMLYTHNQDTGPAEPASYSTNTETATTSASEASTASPSTYTAEQVASHNSAQSCWTSINGSVYDVTSWISQHPGGQVPILSLCGTDGSAAFNDQHGSQRRPNQELTGFKIGTLAP